MVEEKIPLGITGEARRNQFLAAGRFLEEMGVESRMLPTMAVLPDPYDEPVVLTTSGFINEGRLTSLHRWVERGGHLILLLEDNEDDNDLGNLSDMWDFLFRPQNTDMELTEDFLRQFHLDLTGDEPNQTRVRLQRERIEVQVNADRWLRHEPLYNDFFDTAPVYQGNASGAGLVHLRAGAGKLTVIAGKGPLNNAGIGEHQHARLLFRLSENQPVTLLFRPHNPGFFSLIWGYAKWAVLTLAVLILLWLARNLRRFGPLRSTDPSTNRNFIEHIQATGAFFWHRNRPDLMIDPLRERLRAAVKQRFPDMDSQRQITHLARATGRPPLEIDRALHEPVRRKDARQFTFIISTLQTIEHAL